MEDIVLQAPTRAHYNFGAGMQRYEICKEAVETIVDGSDGDLICMQSGAQTGLHVSVSGLCRKAVRRIRD